MKILIVEDEPLVALSLAFLLRVDGHEVPEPANDLESAVASADADKPDLAFVDIQLARGASGYDVAAALAGRGIACFFLTGNIPGGPCPELALGCIPKPHTDEALGTAIAIADAHLSGRPRPRDETGELILY
jgi:CheY-like chemotaxis protein